jgi:hypothetical protein
MALAGALCLAVHAVSGFTNRSLRGLVAGLLGRDYSYLAGPAGGATIRSDPCSARARACVAGGLPTAARLPISARRRECQPQRRLTSRGRRRLAVCARGPRRRAGRAYAARPERFGRPRRPSLPSAAWINRPDPPITAVRAETPHLDGPREGVPPWLPLPRSAGPGQGRTGTGRPAGTAAQRRPLTGDGSPSAMRQMAAAWPPYLESVDLVSSMARVSHRR